MVAIICTIIICATVLAGIMLVKQTLITLYTPTQQPQLYTDEDIAKMVEEASNDKVPNFQDVIDYINKEFTGLTEDNDEEE